MTPGYRLIITVEGQDRLRVEGRSLARRPEAWTADDIEEVIAVLHDRAGLTGSDTESLSPVQFVGRDGACARFRVAGPRATATTDPFPITSTQLLAAGFPPRPSADRRPT